MGQRLLQYGSDIKVEKRTVEIRTQPALKKKYWPDGVKNWATITRDGPSSKFLTGQSGQQLLKVAGPNENQPARTILNE